MNFEIGDLVYHMNVIDDCDERKLTGHVTGFCPSERWVRVRTLDGGRHIWLKEHVENISAEDRMIERA
jgi:hypothetical protein